MFSLRAFRPKVAGITISIALVVASLMLPGASLAEEIPEELCGLDVRVLADQVIHDTLSEDTRSCVLELSMEEKAYVFEIMAELKGVTLSPPSPRPATKASNAIMAFWKQLIERISFSYNGETLRPATTYWVDWLCDDGDASDVDYVFRFNMGHNVTNPDGLRSFSYHVGTDLMLSWYQTFGGGGISGWGDTSSPTVDVCLGDTGVGLAGGAQTVLANINLFQDN